MHPIIPVLDAYIGFPIAYAEALALVSAATIPDDVFSLVSEADADEVDDHERLLLMTLIYGDLRSLVFSASHQRWGRLPAGFWIWQQTTADALGRGIFSRATSPLLTAGMGDTEPFEGSPIMLSEGDVRAFCDHLNSASEAQRDDTPRAANPVTTMAMVTRCKAFLIGEFEKDATGRLTRKHLKECALDLFPDLTGRGFDRSWRDATEHHPDRRAAGRRSN